MSTIDSIKKTLFSLGKKSETDKLVIPLDGYSDEEDDHTKKRFYGFKINHIHFLLDSSVRSEVVNEADIVPIPLMPSCIKGLCNVRGSLVPVYDLYEKLGIEKSAKNPGKSKILVLDENQDMAAIEIDDLPTTLKFDEQDAQENVSTDNQSVNKIITYCYKENGNEWFEFNRKLMFDIAR